MEGCPFANRRLVDYVRLRATACNFVQLRERTRVRIPYYGDTFIVVSTISEADSTR
jgi:hypothetical protein